jgi:hypothetical protein
MAPTRLLIGSWIVRKVCLWLFAFSVTVLERTHFYCSIQLSETSLIEKVVYGRIGIIKRGLPNTPAARRMMPCKRSRALSFAFNLACARVASS